MKFINFLIPFLLCLSTVTGATDKQSTHDPIEQEKTDTLLATVKEKAASLFVIGTTGGLVFFLLTYASKLWNRHIQSQPPFSSKKITPPSSPPFASYRNSKDSYVTLENLDFIDIKDDLLPEVSVKQPSLQQSRPSIPLQNYLTESNMQTDPIEDVQMPPPPPPCTQKNNNNDLSEDDDDDEKWQEVTPPSTPPERRIAKKIPPKNLYPNNIPPRRIISSAIPPANPNLQNELEARLAANNALVFPKQEEDARKSLFAELKKPAKERKVVSHKKRKKSSKAQKTENIAKDPRKSLFEELKKPPKDRKVVTYKKRKKPKKNHKKELSYNTQLQQKIKARRAMMSDIEPSKTTTAWDPTD